MKRSLMITIALAGGLLTAQSASAEPTSPTLEPFGQCSEVRDYLADAYGPSTHTKTNVQAQGVDENDTVKTDGRYTYTVQGRSITNAKIWPVEQTKVVGRIALGDHVAGQSLFLRGNRLVVFGSIYEPGEQPQNNRVGAYGYYRQPKFSGTRLRGAFSPGPR